MRRLFLSWWQRQRLGQRERQGCLSRNFNLLIPSQRASHKTACSADKGSDSCALSSTCQSSNQCPSSSSATGCCSSPLAFSLCRAIQGSRLNVITLSVNGKAVQGD